MSKSVCKYLIAFLVFIFSPVSILAATTLPSNVTLEGDASGLVTIPDNRFLEHLDMMPGDQESGIIEIKNSDKSSFELYLRAHRITEKQDYDLLDKIQLTVTHKDEVIYEGPVSGENGLDQEIYLGTIQPGESETLIAEIKLDGATTTSDYQNQIVQVNWIFSAQREGEQLKPTPDKPNPDKPNSIFPQTPGTGDSSSMFYVIIALGSGALLLRNKIVSKKMND
ncbi:MAG: sortase B protein-sorting domain-containing protein [Turicibacter sp.]